MSTINNDSKLIYEAYSGLEDAPADLLRAQENARKPNYDTRDPRYSEPDSISPEEEYFDLVAAQLMKTLAEEPEQFFYDLLHGEAEMAIDERNIDSEELQKALTHMSKLMSQALIRSRAVM
jgi:hypothetical protein